MAVSTLISITEIEIHEFASNNGYSHAFGMALILVGVLMILTAISAICLQTRNAAQLGIRGNTKTKPRMDQKTSNSLPSDKRNLPQEDVGETFQNGRPDEEKIQTIVYYSKDGFKTGIYHVDRHCCRLKHATNVHVKSITFWRAQNHRPCRFCGNNATSASLRG